MGTAKMQREERRKTEELRSIMPVELREAFEEEDIERTWEYLYKTFHFNISKWKVEYKAYLMESPRGITQMEAFARFGRANFQKPIDFILKRNLDYSETWFNLMKFIVKDKLKEKRKESRFR